MLKREGAEKDYPSEVVERARKWFFEATEKDQQNLLKAIMAGLPGAYDRYDVEGLRYALESYRGMTADNVRANYQRFLNEVLPTAQELGIRLCVHPDDPPRNILGLPRIVSNAKDIDWVMEAFPTQSNGLTLCSGSLGSGSENDVVEIARRHADRIYFAHLRNVCKEPDGSFEEATHLEGDTNMPAPCKVLLDEENTRRKNAMPDWQIPFRPDHGHELLSDPQKKTFPGYPLIGRLRGLAEIRGILHALRA